MAAKQFDVGLFFSAPVADRSDSFCPPGQTWTFTAQGLQQSLAANPQLPSVVGTAPHSRGSKKKSIETLK